MLLKGFSNPFPNTYYSISVLIQVMGTGVKFITNKIPFIGQVSVNISKAVSVSVKKIPIPHL